MSHHSTFQSRARRGPRRGFTLIELLIVVVIRGILAAIAIPKFKNTKGKAHAGAIKSDLKNLATAQEAYFYETGTYTADINMLNLDSSSGVVLTIEEATPGGWSASATHPAAYPLECAIFTGSAEVLDPATREGVIGCR